MTTTSFIYYSLKTSLAWLSERKALFSLRQYISVLQDMTLDQIYSLFFYAFQVGYCFSKLIRNVETYPMREVYNS